MSCLHIFVCSLHFHALHCLPLHFAFTIFAFPVEDCGSADLVYVLDASTSIGDKNYWVTKQFTIDVMKGLTIGEENTRIGMVTYADNAHTRWQLGGETVFLCGCPDFSSCSAIAIQMGWAAWAIWAAIMICILRLFHLFHVISFTK